MIRFYIAKAPIFCLCLVRLLTLRATRAPCRSRAEPPSNLGVELKADASTLKYERHRACLSVKLQTTSPLMYLYTHLEGRRSVELMNLSSKPVRASRAQGFQGPYGGSQLVLTLYRIYIFCFQMCNRLPELRKHGDTGIFPVYYSLNLRTVDAENFTVC